jgi:hypothetical protein
VSVANLVVAAPPWWSADRSALAFTVDQVVQHAVPQRALRPPASAQCSAGQTPPAHADTATDHRAAVVSLMPSTGRFV